jgi:hypothetical protein
VGGFNEELHGPGTAPPQGFKNDSSLCIPRSVKISKVFPALACIPKSSGMARGAGGGTNIGTNIGSCQGIDERGVGENVTRPGE